MRLFVSFCFFLLNQWFDPSGWLNQWYYQSGWLNQWYYPSGWLNHWSYQSGCDVPLSRCTSNVALRTVERRGVEFAGFTSTLHHTDNLHISTVIWLATHSIGLASNYFTSSAQWRWPSPLMPQSVWKPHLTRERLHQASLGPLILSSYIAE